MTTIVVKILFGIIALYFFAAAFVPRIRTRWGISRGISFTLTKAGMKRESYSRRRPRFGMVSCLGMTMFFGGMLTPYFVVSCIAGFILLGIGVVLDWLREPPRNITV